LSEITKNSEGFKSYEYKEVIIERGKESVYANGYPNFGWQLESNSPQTLGLSTVILKFKRDRKIRNKAELTRLQRMFENKVNEIGKLERSITTTACIIS